MARREPLNRNEVLLETRAHVRKALSEDSTGHDWWHTHRVAKVALTIASEQGGDAFVVELGALLHDLADWKFAGGDEHAGPRAAREWLESLGVESAVVDHVCEIVAGVSFKGAGVATPMRSVEGMAVQDADRLDALGAIGIARAFAYGGRIGSALHDPGFTPQIHDSFEEYKKGGSPTTAHFHEKLFLLKDRMLTSTGRRLAEERHAFMEQFIDRFREEWEGVE